MTNTASRPRVSVVVPTYNRPASLLRCLRSLASQTISRDWFEVIVVDDGGSRSVDKESLEAVSRDIQLQVIRQKNSGPATARNRGAWAARAPLIAFTDDDCEPQEDWLESLLEAAEVCPGQGIGGRLLNATGLRGAAASQLLLDYLYSYFNKGPGSSRFFVTANLAFPADAFRALGGFDMSFPIAAAEDRDICDRWLESGRSLAFSEHAVVNHHHPLTFIAFCRQHFNYGRGAYHLHMARARRGQHALKIEPLRFYFGLMMHPMRVEAPHRSLLSVSLLGVSQVVYVYGYIRERVRNADNQTSDSARSA